MKQIVPHVNHVNMCKSRFLTCELGLRILTRTFHCMCHSQSVWLNWLQHQPMQSIVLGRRQFNQDNSSKEMPNAMFQIEEIFSTVTSNSVLVFS